MIDWDAVGAIGEVVGAAAVVITLLYLAVQVRQNTRMVEYSIGRGVHGDAMAWLDKLIGNSELAELYRAGMNGENLSSTDRLRFSLLLTQLFSHWNHAYTHDSFDYVDNGNIPGVLARPGGAAFWKNTASGEHSFDPAFVEHVNGLLAEIEAGRREG